ncbi:hypothetical protein BDQ94DRAFT_163748 [Aspergillus welwitschiae]|uniref:Protein kinase domain-containing protein n=1 Tax=Aspergillus welwitschiae TaxID=1341132 RepID=A0A3F3PK20_9EURO|nr:hypothetical protein BDQ94DRAFT_163748 [Aspergillus welwitschiae]RDH27281.1 hypothetical protein BDQ94DRAFT_163748 [Aspergillus welwitschiae]
MMRPSDHGSLDVVPANLRIVREIDRSDAPSEFEIEIEGRKHALKLNGRDLNRLRCGLNAYMKFREHSVCERGFVPYFYGHLLNAESLNCENYSEACYHQAIEGMKQIRAAHVHHRDIYPKNILIVPGDEERMRWSETEDTYVAEFGESLREDQKQGLRNNTK